MAKKYKALRDRLPKNEPIERELPGGEFVKFKSPLDFEEGTLFPLLERLEKLSASGVQKCVDDLAVDPEGFRKAFKEDESLGDADYIGLLKDVGEEFGERMGSMGESKG